jgi:TolB-like protein/Tfp pilus assembly protein PilF
MTDELIGTLGHFSGVNVISRTSVMKFKGSKQTLPEIARALHVDAVLEGSVILLPGSRTADRSDPARVRINARLIQAGTDTQLWDRTFERIGGDVLRLQSEIARAVADGIDLHLTSQQQRVLAKNSESPKPQQFDAFDLYLKGRYYWNMRTDEGLKRSIGYFQEAIDRDPTYALGYSGLADAYNVLALYGFAPWSDTLQRASTAATKALALDESLAEAHVSLAFIHNQRLEWTDAEKGFKAAIALKPGYAVGHHFYANCLMQLGRFPEAIAEIDKAVELDPLSIAVIGGRGAILLVARRYDEAVTQLEKSVQMDPAVSRAHIILAEAYAHKRQYDRALAEIDTAAKLQGGGGATLRADIGYILAASGRRADAMKVVADLTNRYRQREGGSAGALGVVYAGLADKERAFEWLNRAVQTADPLLPDLKTDPRLDNVRGDPRFAKLLASAGFAH